MFWEQFHLVVKAKEEIPGKSPGRKGGKLGPGKKWGHTLNAVHQGKLVYVFGGYGKDEKQTNDIYVFNTSKEAWSKPNVKGTPPTPRDSHTCTAVDNFLFVFGGTDGSSGLNDLYMLDTNSNTWAMLKCGGLQPSPREGHAAARVGNKIFVFGGCGKAIDGADETYYNDIHIFDPEVMQWSYGYAHGVPPSPRDSHSCVSWGNQLVVFGGEDSNNSYLNDVYVLDTDTLEWREMPMAGAVPHPRAGHVSVAVGRFMIVFGGFTDDRRLFNDLHVLDMATGHWNEHEVSDGSPSSRFSLSADLIDAATGKIMFYGGCNEDLEALDDAYFLQTGISANAGGEIGSRKAKLSMKDLMKMKAMEAANTTAPPGAKKGKTGKGYFNNLAALSFSPQGFQSEVKFEAKIVDVFHFGYCLRANVNGVPLEGLLFSYNPSFPRAAQARLAQRGLEDGKMKMMMGGGGMGGMGMSKKKRKRKAQAGVDPGLLLLGSGPMTDVPNAPIGSGSSMMEVGGPSGSGALPVGADVDGAAEERPHYGDATKEVEEEPLDQKDEVALGEGEYKMSDEEGNTDVDEGLVGKVEVMEAGEGVANSLGMGLNPMEGIHRSGGAQDADGGIEAEQGSYDEADVGGEDRKVAGSHLGENQAEGSMHEGIVQVQESVQYGEAEAYGPMISEGVEDAGETHDEGTGDDPSMEAAEGDAQGFREADPYSAGEGMSQGVENHGSGDVHDSHMEVQEGEVVDYSVAHTYRDGRNCEDVEGSLNVGTEGDTDVEGIRGSGHDIHEGVTASEQGSYEEAEAVGDEGQENHQFKVQVDGSEHKDISELETVGYSEGEADLPEAVEGGSIARENHLGDQGHETFWEGEHQNREGTGNVEVGLADRAKAFNVRDIGLSPIVGKQGSDSEGDAHEVVTGPKQGKHEKIEAEGNVGKERQQLEDAVGNSMNEAAAEQVVYEEEAFDAAADAGDNHGDGSEDHSQIEVAAADSAGFGEAEANVAGEKCIAHELQSHSSGHSHDSHVEVSDEEEGVLSNGGNHPVDKDGVGLESSFHVGTDGGDADVDIMEMGGEKESRCPNVEGEGAAEEKGVLFAEDDHTLTINM